MIEDFLHLPPVSLTPVANLELRISPIIFEKFETTLMVYSGAWGKLIREKNQKSKISWHRPFKPASWWWQAGNGIHLFSPIISRPDTQQGGGEGGGVDLIGSDRPGSAWRVYTYIGLCWAWLTRLFSGLLKARALSLNRSSSIIISLLWKRMFCVEWL